MMVCMYCGDQVIRIPDSVEGTGFLASKSVLERVGGRRTGKNVRRCPARHGRGHRVAPEDLQDLEAVEEWLDAGY